MAISAASGVNNLIQNTNSAAAGNANTISVSANYGTGVSNATGAFQSLAQNEDQFLKLLTTQLQHQDPTSPMDNQAMASELAQFSAVEQQVQTNKNLESLISLNETSALSQSNQLVGKEASATTTTLPLQSGKSSLSFIEPRGQMVAIAIADGNGRIVKNEVVSATGHQQKWEWDGKNNDGNQLADGAYSVAVKTTDPAGNISDVSFQSHGTITAIVKGSDGLYVQMGDAVIPMSAVTSEQDSAPSSDKGKEGVSASSQNITNS